VVTSDKVEKVTAVRYGWVNFAKPTLNLFNKEGLPASPFRTDDLPLTTAPKDKK
jgi:sialate O-acetylesterase